MKKTPRKSKAASKYPERDTDVFVTQKMLYGVRDELKEHIASAIHGVKSELGAEIHGVKSELGAEIHGVKSELQDVKSELHSIKADIHKLTVLVEEQNARNIIVLDGLGGLFHRQDRLENEWSDFRKSFER